jgi:hypothetical protein
LEEAQTKKEKPKQEQKQKEKQIETFLFSDEDLKDFNSYMQKL